MNVCLQNLTKTNHSKLWTDGIQFSYLYSNTCKTTLQTCKPQPIVKFVMASAFHLLFFVSPRGWESTDINMDPLKSDYH